MISKEDEKREEALYEQVAGELATGEINQGLWLKASVDSDGSEFVAKSLYAKYRVKQLKREMEEVRIPQLKASGIVVCPSCRSEVLPKKKAKGNLFIGLLLCLLYVVPGLIYFLVMSGYKHVCPKCRTVISRDLIRI